MTKKLFLRAFLAALVASSISLGGAFGLAAQIRKQARAVSHEQPESTKQMPRPNLPIEEATQKGRKLFLNSCAHCHGEDARGDEGPDLHDLEVSDRRIAAVIKRGIKGEMPSFSKKHSDAEISLLLVYLRSLSRT
jgi:mono/diheme cytochrome c family protein